MAKIKNFLVIKFLLLFLDLPVVSFFFAWTFINKKGTNGFQVAERALFLLNNDRVSSLASRNRQTVMPLILPALERNIRSHWNLAVLNLTRNVKKMLCEMDGELYSACENNFEQEELEQKTVEEQRRRTWERLETTAAFQPLTESMPVLVRPAIVPPAVAALSWSTSYGTWEKLQSNLDYAGC